MIRMTIFLRSESFPSIDQRHFLNLGRMAEPQPGDIDTCRNDRSSLVGSILMVWKNRIIDTYLHKKLSSMGEQP